MSLRSYLSRLQPYRPLDEVEIDRLATRAWHEHGILLVNVSALRSDLLRRGAQAIAEQLFGRRKPTEQGGERHAGK